MYKYVQILFMQTMENIICVALTTLDVPDCMQDAGEIA
ncbi:hypothetical protein PR003_g12839 [Phytophthora rubi]|uniref:Uncharacterized protein n=1 Tax=Phytophthora rubi TaxID=129364 RepID=A0A6A3KFJ9_9STRA|nr:hypothetical protein PR002_g17317 [Phytophthora rubi]KAE9335791.1 hypothetical protein PR003_g12839 [Phytophthora rubi]